MLFWDVGVAFTGVTPTRSTRSDVSHGGNTTFQTAHSNSLNPGVYLVSVSYTPSDDSGNYPNGDPDHWETRITLDGTQVGDTAYGNEGAPRTYYSAGSLTTVISWRSGAKTIASQYRTTDGDAGGMRGYLITQIAIIMEYA